MLFTCIKSWFFRNHLANFHQISHWSYCWNGIDSLFKWLCSINCQAHIYLFKTKNCSNDDLFIGCDDRIGKILHNICISAVAMSLRWASRGPWASCSDSEVDILLQTQCLSLNFDAKIYISAVRSQNRIQGKSNQIREKSGKNQGIWLLKICGHAALTFISQSISHATLSYLLI